MNTISSDNSIQLRTGSVRSYAESRSRNHNLGQDESPDVKESDTSVPVKFGKRVRLAEQALSVYVDRYA